MHVALEFARCPYRILQITYVDVDVNVDVDVEGKVGENFWFPQNFISRAPIQYRQLRRLNSDVTEMSHQQDRKFSKLREGGSSFGEFVT